ncbi:MAG TPA: putative LPS assembly protein LptD, partial [Bacteroidales bacterium]|nr:putative LPS assembly protein LptD [Bacteroidales bacterium]
RIQYNTNTGQYDTVSYIYSIYEGAPYGSPTRGGAGSVSFNIANNLETKVRNRADTVTGDKKIKILESLNFSTNYNIMADSLNWSPVNMSGRTRIGKLELSFNSIFDPYAIAKDPYNDIYKRINKSEFSETGNLFRITSASLSTSFSLNPRSSKNKDENQTAMLYGYPDAYVDFDVPWNIRVSYNLRYDKPYDEKIITQTLQFSGELNLTAKWKIRMSSGWDFANNKITYTVIDVYRDLHCWEASLRLIPFGIHKSYTFQINVKSAILQDLKLSKRRSWYDNF